MFVFSIQERRRKIFTKNFYKSVYRNFSYNTIHVFIHQKTDKQSKNCLLLSKISQSNCKWSFFLVKYGAPYGGYPGFRATMQRHHMGISGIRSKQLRATYGVSQARWLIIKDLRSSILIFTPQNSQFLKPQNLLQSLLI